MPKLSHSRVRGRIVRPFDPWGSADCTCPPKLTFNPYTGCAHGCLYCYITSYIPRAFEVRTKRDLLHKVERDLEELEIEGSISLSNSSDPYPPMEEELRITREVLEMLSNHKVGVQIVTKSDLVARDADVLSGMSSVVSVSLTTLNEDLTWAFEPGAPPPERRLRAMKRLKERGIPVVVRVDPVIPGLNDSRGSLVALFERLEGVADHVVGSTVKLRPDGFRRMERRFPNVVSRNQGLYRRNGTLLGVRDDLRLGILERLRELSQSRGMTFGSCREGFSALHTAPSCDGSHLLRRTGRSRALGSCK